MTHDSTTDTMLDIIRLKDEVSDDATRQLAAYKRKAQMLLLSWRRGFTTEEVGRDYPLEGGELLQLRSSNAFQLLAEHRLEDNTRIRYDYDEGRANDKLIVTAYEASGEALTVEGTLAEQYDQMAGLLYICAAFNDKQ